MQIKRRIKKFYDKICMKCSDFLTLSVLLGKFIPLLLLIILY